MVTKLSVFKEVMPVEDVAVYQAIVMLCLGGQLHNVVETHLRRFHLLPARQHAAQVSHWRDHPRAEHRRGDHGAGSHTAFNNHRRAEHNHCGIHQTLYRHPPTDKPLREFAGA
ncbi:Uncharacterised protein [Salmonella enterica subsp. enterica serovar Typhimurium str. DT104]|nr:Uncharacterised protein [Salmonella enterica subsp. enterica serovar Typhimurium str. DT104]